MKRLAITIATLTLLAGCGTSAGLPAALQDTAVQSVSTQSAVAPSLPTDLVISGATSRVVVPSPMPGHLLPVDVMTTFRGQDADGPIAIAVKTHNPGGERFVPLVASVTINGKDVSASEWRGLGSELSSATQETRIIPLDGDSLSAISALELSSSI